MVSDCYLKKYSHNIIQTWCLHLLGQCSQLICFGGIWPNFGPPLAKKLMKLGKNGHFRPSVVNYPLNPINSWCPHLFGEASQMIPFLACSRACASKVFSLRADCGRVIVYPGLKQWERPRHNIFGVCTRLAGGVCMSTSANSSASKHLTVTKIVWKIVYVTFDYLISHFFKILSLEFMANLFRDFRASVSLKVFHYRLRGKWCQYDLEIN